MCACGNALWVATSVIVVMYNVAKVFNKLEHVQDKGCTASLNRHHNKSVEFINDL